MRFHHPLPKSLAAALFAALALVSCLNEGAANGPAKSVTLGEEASSDRRLSFLTKELGIEKEAITLYVDSVRRDTSYIIGPVFSKAAQATARAKNLPLRGGALGLTFADVDSMIVRSEKLKSKTDGGVDISYLKEKLQEKKQGDISGAEFGRSIASQASGKALGKQAHTRWVHWTSLLDVKALTEVRKVRVFLKAEGSDRMGPNWITGFRNAIAAWSAQSKGTAISFVETNDINAADVVVRSAYGFPTGVTYILWLNSGPYVGRIPQYGGDGSKSVDIVVNAGFEYITTGGIPISEKTRIGMAALVNIFNIGWIDTEGLYWNYGDYTYIPGTVRYDGDAFTPGSSILTQGTTPVSTPVMTAGDKHLFSAIYPLHGATGLMGSLAIGIANNSGILYTGSGMFVQEYSVEGDTLIFRTNDGKLFRRIGNGNSTQIWPGSGSSGNVAAYVHSQGYFFVITAEGRAYTKTPTGSWVMQYGSGISPSTNMIRLDGQKAYISTPDPVTGVPRIHLKYLTWNPNTWHLEFIGEAPGSLTDFQAGYGILAVADQGNLYAKQDGVYDWVHIHNRSSGMWAKRIMLSDYLIAYFRAYPGANYGHASVVIGGVNGYVYHHWYSMSSSEDMDVCGDKFAYIYWGDWSVRVIDYTNWVEYDHSSLPNFAGAKQVRLSGSTCEFVTLIKEQDWSLWAKFGVGLNTDYFKYPHGLVLDLWKRP